MIGLADQAAKGRAYLPKHRNLLLPRLFAATLASAVLSWSAQAQQRPTSVVTNSAVVSNSAPGVPLIANTVTSGRQATTLRRLWGIDDIHVRHTASGSMIRFSYRVVDAPKAKILNDKKLNPYMIVHKTGARLEVPETEKIGKLRQTAEPENGREYWMIFTNAGRVLKPGDRVDIVIGTFRADELVVESSGPAPRVQQP